MFPSSTDILGIPGRHPYLELWYWAAQIILVAAAIGAAMVGVRQLRLFERFEILKYLQTPEVRAARRHVFSAENKPYCEWSEDDKWKASTVCSSYDVAGLLLRQKLFARWRGR